MLEITEVVPLRSSGLVGREGFQGPYREIPDASWGRAFQTKGKAYAKALRREAGAPLGNCMQGKARSEGHPAGDNWGEGQTRAWRSGKRHHSPLDES